MKILFFTDNYPPEVNALASRTFEHCQVWRDAGADVTVITCAPNFPQGKLYPGYSNKLHQREVRDGIRIVRTWSYITRNTGIVLRIVDYVSFAITAFLGGLAESPDVIIASSPQFFPTLSGYALSVVKRRPWIFELRDLWPESVIAVGAMKPNLMIRIFEKIEMFLYRHADGIVAVSPAFVQNLARRGIDTGKISLVPNGVDRAQFPISEPDRSLQSALGLQGKFVVGYLGTHGMAHALDFIVRSAAKISDERIHFLFVGDGAEKAGLVRLAGALKLKNMTFVDPVPKEEVKRYLSLFDVALVPLRNSETFRSVIPSKIFEAGAMQKPILLGVDGQARQIVEQYDAGLFFEPENERSFIEAVLRLSGDSALRERLKAGGDKLADAYDRKRLALEMLDVITQTARRRRDQPYAIKN